MSNCGLTPAQLETLANEIAVRLADKLANRPQLVDRHQLSKIIGLSVPTIDRRRKVGDIPFIQSGPRILFEPSVVIAALAEKGIQ